MRPHPAAPRPSSTRRRLVQWAALVVSTFALASCGADEARVIEDPSLVPERRDVRAEDARGAEDHSDEARRDDDLAHVPDASPPDSTGPGEPAQDVLGDIWADVGHEDTSAGEDVDAGDVGDEEPDALVPPERCEAFDGLGRRLFPMTLSVDAALQSSCSTQVVAGLSLQLIDEINCLQPGLMASFQSLPRTRLRAVVFPFLQANAVEGLRRALQERPNATLEVSSALRTLAQQYLLYRWSQLGRCGISIAAPPGRSNHNGGLAIDTPDYEGWRSAMQRAGWAWFGPNDVVHFDYVLGPVEDIRELSVLAFQRLWNRNHPSDRIAEDGVYGPQTEARLRSSPADGFALGAPPACRDPEPPVTVQALPADWWRDLEGAWTFAASPPPNAHRVTYEVDGFPIGGVYAADDPAFNVTYTFEVERPHRRVRVQAYDAAERLVAASVGYVDVVPGTGLSLKPDAANTWLIALERAPACVGAIEVEVDGWLLRDLDSGQTRINAPHLNLRYRFTALGPRRLTLRAFDEAGEELGTLERDVVLE